MRFNHFSAKVIFAFDLTEYVALMKNLVAQSSKRLHRIIVYAVYFSPNMTYRGGEIKPCNTFKARYVIGSWRKLTNCHLLPKTTTTLFFPPRSPPQGKKSVLMTLYDILMASGWSEGKWLWWWHWTCGTWMVRTVKAGMRRWTLSWQCLVHTRAVIVNFRCEFSSSPYNHAAWASWTFLNS